MARPTRKLLSCAEKGRAFLCARFELNVGQSPNTANGAAHDRGGGKSTNTNRMGALPLPSFSRWFHTRSDLICNVVPCMRLLTWLPVESPEGSLHWGKGCWSGWAVTMPTFYWYNCKSWWLCWGVQCLYRVITVSFPLCDQLRHLCEGRNSHAACTV